MCEAYIAPVAVRASIAARVVAVRSPGTSRTAAPYARIWRCLPAEVRSGTNTVQGRPARAAYAAIALPALPLESATSALAPRCTDDATNTTAPRSLNDSVGNR